jgi:hypothetical protein
VLLSDLANIGSLLSAISVFVTLIFLVLQIRQSNRNQRALIQQGRASRSADFLLHVIEPSLLPAWTMGLEGAADIGADRHFQFMYMARARLLSLEDSFLQRQAGLMTQSTFDGHAEAFKSVYAAPGLRAAWKMTRGSYDSEFAKFIDAMAKEYRPRAAQPPLDRWLQILQSITASDSSGS